jgi:rare lipoprotein A
LRRAIWYGAESGAITATGEHFNPEGKTAASRHYSFGPRLRIVYGARDVIVRVNDRGPAKRIRRCIDLSHGAERSIGLTGVKTVHLKRLN